MSDTSRRAAVIVVGVLLLIVDVDGQQSAPAVHRVAGFDIQVRRRSGKP